ncbi:hypothetical protein OG21DRAFT_1511810, partial [Imleria badia]
MHATVEQCELKAVQLFNTASKTKSTEGKINEKKKTLGEIYVVSALTSKVPADARRHSQV